MVSLLPAGQPRQMSILLSYIPGASQPSLMGVLNEKFDNFGLAHAFPFGKLVELCPGGIRQREIGLSLALAIGLRLLGLESPLDLLKMMKLLFVTESGAI